nr:hypothetical protein [Escherichia coli]
MPDAELYIQSVVGDGLVNVRMLVELVTVRMQGAEDADYRVLFAGQAEHGPGGSAEQNIEQGPVVVKKGPRHGKGNVLSVAVGEDVALL